MAIATFYALGNVSGVKGIHREHIQATASWRKGPACYDCVLVNANPDIDGACRFEIANVLLFFSFQHQDREYPCALVQWFSFKGLDEDMGFWMVEPDINYITGQPHLTVLHLYCIYQAIHLMPAPQNANFIDHSITMHTSLDSFKLFYINNFIDHHAFATL